MTSWCLQLFDETTGCWHTLQKQTPPRQDQSRLCATVWNTQTNTLMIYLYTVSTVQAHSDHSKMRHLPGALCVTVFERLPFIFTHRVDPSITCKTWEDLRKRRHDFEVVRIICDSGTHSVSLCLWWSLQIGKCGPVTQEWKSAKTGPQDPAGERSYSEAGRVRGNIRATKTSSMCALVAKGQNKSADLCET